MLGDVEETTAPFGLLQVYGDGGDIREHIAELPRELADRLRRASRDVGVGLASLCHLAWALVVARTSGRDDVVFGTVIFGRMNAETAMDHVMGPFFNSLPIRLTIDKTSVIEAVRKTQRLLTELLVHEHASLAQAQRCSAVPPGLPLFSSLFNYRHVAKAERTDFDVVPLEISTVQSSERTNYPIGLSVDDRGTDLRLVAHVEPSVDPRQVCRMMETALEALASHLAEAPQHSLSEIDVLPVETRAQIMEEWNATSVAYPAERYVHELFEMQARRIPDAAAVVHQGQSLTYAELNIRANRLAHHLIERGVRPDDRVAICVERSLEMVVGLLAVLKAGAAYLPVDPSYPVERQAHMLTDSAPAVVLTREADTVKDAMDLAHAKGLSDLPVIDLVQDAWRLNGCTNANPDPGKLGLTPNHLAYVIYTSGSTGQPKGVMVEHRGFVNLVTEQIRAFALRPGSRCLQFASMSFDASASEIFTTLCSGAALHLVPRRRAQDTSWLQRELADKAVTHVTLPSAVLANFTDDIALPRLETLVVAGDPLAPALANRWRHGRRLINAYGPTEATVCASMHLCVEDYDLQVPIGRPIANGRIYILDGRGRPVPIGVAGEIHIGGVGVARGYLNRPELTAQRFLDDPYVPCGRVYRTGDLGRWRADGDIEFLGRNDFQVKLRGFRVELGEIEAKLAEHAAVREAVVLVREDQPGDKRLVAYVVPVLNARPEAKDLRVHVAAGLPEHMVPAAYVILDTLPLGPNGKPDRRALPAPDLAALATTAFERPRDGIETRVATIWQELLDIKRIGRRDNFFDLGGNSLLAVSMISHLQSQFDVTVDLAELFQKPMLADVAELIVLLQLEQFESDDLADALDQLERS
jgi:amino acid adenylation domain-containing protein